MKNYFKTYIVFSHELYILLFVHLVMFDKALPASGAHEGISQNYDTCKFLQIYHQFFNNKNDSYLSWVTK